MPATTCPFCGQPVALVPELVGQRVSCPHCQNVGMMMQDGIDRPAALPPVPVPPPLAATTGTSFICPNCQRPVVCQGNMGGLTVVCPACQSQVVVPPVVQPAYQPQSAPGYIPPVRAMDIADGIAELLTGTGRFSPKPHSTGRSTAGRWILWSTLIWLASLLTIYFACVAPASIISDGGAMLGMYACTVPYIVVMFFAIIAYVASGPDR